MKTIDDVIREANIAGLRGQLVIGVIPPITATSDGYMLIVQPYEVKSATERDLRF